MQTQTEGKTIEKGKRKTGNVPFKKKKKKKPVRGVNTHLGGIP